MNCLFTIIFSMTSTVLMGGFIVIALVMGMVTLRAIVIAAALGFLLALPVSWIITRQISG